MIEKIKALCQKHREILVYLIVGGLTTVVSFACKFLCSAVFYGLPEHPTSGQNLVLSIVENVSGIAFAYPTNRKWVFRSKNPNILAEAGSFVGSRLFTFLMSIGLNQLFTNLLGLPSIIGTVVSAVFVIVGNYVISKLLVFRKKKEELDDLDAGETEKQ